MALLKLSQPPTALEISIPSHFTASVRVFLQQGMAGRLLHVQPPSCFFEIIVPQKCRINYGRQFFNILDGLFVTANANVIGDMHLHQFFGRAEDGDF